MKGVIAMYDNKWKKGGAIISAIALLGMVAERLKGFIIFKKFTVAQHYGLFEWFMLFGLFIIIYSKEKYDDERAKMIRLKTLQLSFMIVIGVIMGMAFTGTIATGLTIGPPELYLIAAMGIVLYLLVFHIGLYFDFLWEYDDKGVWENLRNIDKNKWSLIVYLLLTAVMMLLLTLL